MKIDTQHLKTLDLFSGIGGFALAAKMIGGFETVGFCEIDPHCQKVLSKNFPEIPIHDDIQSLTARTFPNRIDCITAGFPCQDISGANPNGRGLEGERSGLFFELMRVVCEIRPRYLVLENVAEMLRKQDGRVMGTVLRELSESGFDAEWQTISAASVGAPHLRERVFIVAYSRGKRRNNSRTINSKDAIPNNQEWNSTKNIRTWDGWQRWLKSVCSTRNWFETPTGVCGMDDGVSVRMDRDRIKGLGNAVVPQVAMIPLKRVLDLDHALENMT